MSAYSTADSGSSSGTVIEQHIDRAERLTDPQNAVAVGGQERLTADPNRWPGIQDKTREPTAGFFKTNAMIDDHIVHGEKPIEAQNAISLSGQERFTAYPNRWSPIRDRIREPAAEFFGTMILVLFGTAVQCQVTLSSDSNVSATPKGDYLSSSFGWGVGVALGVWLSAGISGGHINPAVTLTLAVFRGFPWRKVPSYMFAQLMGALVGAFIAYANYFHAIDIFEGGRHVRTMGTAGLFATYSAPYMTTVSSFFEEFLATAILLIVVLAITDRHNSPPPAGLVPLVLFVLLVGISAAFGMQSGFAVNPARDLGPRIMTAMVGYGREVFTYNHQYWIWCPIIAPFLGALTGAVVYDACFFTGSESIFNRPKVAVRQQDFQVHGGQMKQVNPTDVSQIV